MTYANGAVENRDFWDETGLAYTFNVSGSNWYNNQTYTFNNVGTLTDRSMDIGSVSQTSNHTVSHNGIADIQLIWK